MLTAASLTIAWLGIAVAPVPRQPRHALIVLFLSDATLALILSVFYGDSAVSVAMAHLVG